MLYYVFVGRDIDNGRPRTPTQLLSGLTLAVLECVLGDSAKRKEREREWGRERERERETKRGRDRAREGGRTSESERHKASKREISVGRRESGVYNPPGLLGEATDLFSVRNKITQLLSENTPVSKWGWCEASRSSRREVSGETIGATNGVTNSHALRCG